MYDDNQKKTILTIFLFMRNKALLLLVLGIVVVLMHYFFDFHLASNPYFEIHKQNFETKKKQEDWKIEKIGQHFYVLGNTLQIVDEQGEEIAFTTPKYPLSTQCLVSSLQVSKLQGIIVGCVDGTIQILRLLENESLVFERQYRQIKTAVLGTVWDGSDVVVLALYTDSKNIDETTNNMDLYRYVLRNGTWNLQTHREQVFRISQFDSLFSVQEGILFLNSDAGIEMIRRDSITHFEDDVRMLYAGGFNDFYLLHSASKDEEVLRIIIQQLVELRLSRNLISNSQNLKFNLEQEASSQLITLKTEHNKYQVEYIYE